MSTTETKPTSIANYLIVEDVDRSVQFYQDAFGFKLIEKMPAEDGISCHSEMLFNNEFIMFGRAGAWDMPMSSPKQSGVNCPITVCLTVPNVEAFYAHALKNGAVSVSLPEDAPWGARMCRLQDPDHYVWCIHEPVTAK